MSALNRRPSYKWLFVSVCLVALLVHSYFAFKEVAKITTVERQGLELGDQIQIYATLLDKAQQKLPSLQYYGLPANHLGLADCERMHVSFHTLHIYKHLNLSTVAWCYPVEREFERGFSRVLGDATCRRWLASFMSLCCFVGLGLHVLHWCRSFRTFLKQQHFFLSAALRAVFDYLRKRCISIACYNLQEGDKQVVDEFLKQRRQYAAIFLAVASPIITMSFTISVLNLNRRYVCFFSKCVANNWSTDVNKGAWGGGWNYDEHVNEHLGQMLIGSEILPLCFACVIFFNLKRAHPLPTPESLNRANVLLSGMWIWRFATLPWKYYYRYSPIIWAARLIQGIAFGNFRLACGLHITVSLADIFVHAAHQGSFSVEGVYEEDVGYALSQLLVVLLVCALTFSFEYLLSVQAKGLLDANRSNNSHMLVHRLLSAMCDCIVHLDSDFCISKECPQLANLLLHQRKLPTYIRQRFAMFLREPDRERFTNHMQEELSLQEALHDNVSSHRSPHPLHLHLIDAGGTLVSVEVFCSIVKDVDGNCMCLVGIKEDVDPSLWRDGGQSGLAGEAHPKRDLTARAFDPIDELTCSQSSVEDDCSLVDVDNDGRQAEAVVWIRAETDSWEILRCNSLFPLFTPQVVRRTDTLRTWIADRNSRDALKDAIKKSEAGTAKTKGIKLQPPGLPKRSFWLVDCSVQRLDHPEIEDANGVRNEPPFLRLAFSKFKKGKEKDHHKRPSWNSATPISL